MLSFKDILQCVSSTADATDFPWRFGYELLRKRSRWVWHRRVAFGFGKCFHHSMMERWNQLWVKFASHRARREVREKAAMVAMVVTYTRHLVNENCS